MKHENPLLAFNFRALSMLSRARSGVFPPKSKRPEKLMVFKDLELFENISADCMLDQLNIEYTIPDKEIIKCKDRWIELQ